MWAPGVLEWPGGPRRPPSARLPQHPRSNLPPSSAKSPPSAASVRNGIQNLRGLTKKSQTQNLGCEHLPPCPQKTPVATSVDSRPRVLLRKHRSSLCHPEGSEGQAPVLQGHRPSEGGPQSRRLGGSRDSRQATHRRWDHGKRSAGPRSSLWLSRSPGPRPPPSCRCRDGRLAGRVQDPGRCLFSEAPGWEARGKTHRPHACPGACDPGHPVCGPAGSAGPRTPRCVQQGPGEQRSGSSAWTESGEKWGSRGPPPPCLCPGASGWSGWAWGCCFPIPWLPCPQSRWLGIAGMYLSWFRRPPAWT